MKIPDKQELHQIRQILALKTLWLYKKCTVKPYSFLVNDTTLASDNPLCFRRNFSERIQKLIITIDSKIREDQLQYDINRKAEKISALSSGKIEK